MADNFTSRESKLSGREKEILAFWRDQKIFEKSLERNKKAGKEFVFYEGPPTANARPGIHHLEARAFKDAIPRYKTMRGYYVRRKGGWDTHGLPVELQVEKELGLKSKKEIEAYGVEGFNTRCKESVWTHVKEWADFTERIGYWVDLDNPYITYRSSYIESLWHIVSSVHAQGLLYKDYKVVPWCPRCGTALSSHELAQGYQDTKDLSVYVKFPVVGKKDTYFLAWTTTPWTLPGNVALAVGNDIDYVEIEIDGEEEVYILAKERLSLLKDKVHKILKTHKGSALVGMQYEPLYPFLSQHISGSEKEKLANAYKVYPADFVTTADGTGIVHTAVMYGQDDFELGTKVGLPKFHLVNDDGTFRKEAGDFAGKFVKDPDTDVDIIKDLATKGRLFAKEKYGHSYPFCWRCKTPLIYFARDSWYIKMSALRDALVKENDGINWEPTHIKEGRFGEWLREIKDWAISRERYWGTPLPVWRCDSCDAVRVVSSVREVEGSSSGNTFIFVRHGQSENNVQNRLNGDVSARFALTEAGRGDASRAGEELAPDSVDLIFASPLLRTRETAEIIAKKIGFTGGDIIFDERIKELNFGEWEGISVEDYYAKFKTPREHLTVRPNAGENYMDVKARVGAFLSELETNYRNKRILIVSHEAPIWMGVSVLKGLDIQEIIESRPAGTTFVRNGEIMKGFYRNIPRNKEFELDLHRPYIDAVTLPCECGKTMRRVKEVMDVWFDSGAMPFAQDHYPFERRERIDTGVGYPADFISEAIDQTRGWFYTLHAVGALLNKGKAYKNVICLGHILDTEGKKMSKSLGNTVDPWLMMEKYGADPLRFWMYSVNAPGDSKNFDERSVDEVVKKVFNLASNVLSFYELYAPKYSSAPVETPSGSHVLDRWILSRLAEVLDEVTKGFEAYKLLEPSRALRDFIADLSQWYLRRSRERIKEGGPEAVEALTTLSYVLLVLSKLMAPLTPFFAEDMYQRVGGREGSVHLDEWPTHRPCDADVLSHMATTRRVVSLALEARAKANVKIRQPLSRLTVRESLPAEYLEVIADEVNVKEVIVDGTRSEEVFLDVVITPALKKEGDMRDAIRSIQELRKEKGLLPGQSVVLVTSKQISDTGLIQEFEKEIQKAASIKEIKHGASTDADFLLL